MHSLKAVHRFSRHQAAPNKRRSRAPPQIALDIAKGLVFLHSRRIVHLDLKSPNILLSRWAGHALAPTGRELRWPLRPRAAPQLAAQGSGPLERATRLGPPAAPPPCTMRPGASRCATAGAPHPSRHRDGTAKIADVGLAKIIAQEYSAVTGAVGTLAWVRPRAGASLRGVCRHIALHTRLPAAPPWPGWRAAARSLRLVPHPPPGPRARRAISTSHWLSCLLRTGGLPHARAPHCLLPRSPLRKCCLARGAPKNPTSTRTVRSGGTAWQCSSADRFPPSLPACLLPASPAPRRIPCHCAAPHPPPIRAWTPACRCGAVGDCHGADAHPRPAAGCQVSCRRRCLPPPQLPARVVVPGSQLPATAVMRAPGCCTGPMPATAAALSGRRGPVHRLPASGGTAKKADACSAHLPRMHALTRWAPRTASQPPTPPPPPHTHTFLGPLTPHPTPPVPGAGFPRTAPTSCAS